MDSITLRIQESGSNPSTVQGSEAHRDEGQISSVPGSINN